jgi:hypothetical protein
MDKIESRALEFADRASRFLKAELKRANVTQDQLARRLTQMGLPETKASIANKLSRGSFSAVFFLAALKAIGRQSISLNDL